MPNYRRAFVPGGTFFFTLVADGRRPLFLDAQWRDCLGQAWRTVQASRPFQTVAVCLLPDHLHAVLTLPPGDADFSTRWGAIKGTTSRLYRLRRGGPPDAGASRRRRGEVGLWQRRFFEKTVRGGCELEALVDYVHFNPIKHGLVARPDDWPWSTYARYAERSGRSGDPGVAVATVIGEGIRTNDLE